MFILFKKKTILNLSKAKLFTDVYNMQLINLHKTFFKQYNRQKDIKHHES